MMNLKVLKGTESDLRMSFIEGKDKPSSSAEDGLFHIRESLLSQCLVYQYRSCARKVE